MQKYRISLECGDTSSLRSKKTPDGFTHDWNVWIKGANDAPIHHYIDKVVFNLHETFPKPKRVIKEPPYCLTESGYAGFDIPIHVYLKNKNEPKRFDILYNLNLDTTTPTVSHRSLHNEIIVNPTEEFRKKLLKGGAMPTNVGNPLEKNQMKTLSLVGKPKLSGNSEARKRKIEEPKTSNQFTDLFGPPIKTAKLMYQENKKTVSHGSLHEAIVNPTEELRKKLMKGGAMPTNVGNPLEKNQMKTLSLVGKPKLSGNSEARKRKIEEPKTSNQFTDLFGPPIKTAKLTQEIKKTSEKPNSLKAPAVPEKSDKVDKSTKVKHSSHKDSKKEKKEKEKDGVKDKEKSKDKSKRSSSPSVSKASQHSSDKRSSKDKTSSLAPTVKRLSSRSSKSKEKEIKKHPKNDKDRKKEEKSKGSSKSTRDEVKTERSGKESKSERKEERKKHEGDRDKEKNDKVRDKSEDKDGVKSIAKKGEKPSKGEKKSETKPRKEEKKSSKTLKEDVKPKEEKILKPKKIEISKKEKSKESKSEKSDKSENKYRSKDKKEKRDGSQEREKKDNREKSKSSSESKSSKITHPILMITPGAFKWCLLIWLEADKSGREVRCDRVVSLSCTSFKPVPVCRQTPFKRTLALVTKRILEIVDMDDSDSNSFAGDSDMEARQNNGGTQEKKWLPPAKPLTPTPMDDKKHQTDMKHDWSKGRQEEMEKRERDIFGSEDEKDSVPVKTIKDYDHSILPEASDPNYLLHLLKLQRKINAMEDVEPQALFEIAQLIFETGKYNREENIIDFDLYQLDRRTLELIHEIILPLGFD